MNTTSTQIKPRRSRARLATGLLAALAALSIAGPAQADLVGGVTNGGCVTGIQVGHVTHASGAITPICQTFG